MTLTALHADQIATLLNERNRLTIEYDQVRVLRRAENYLCRFSETNDVIACLELKIVQWYQAEVLHLTVAVDYERQGHAKALLCQVEQVARKKGVPLLQCTIRSDNDASRRLFEGFGFLQAATFHNDTSGNNIAVFQKILAAAH